ncbi:MAG TPA: efflux RND transporter periplasmic adaptor subunit [bacterium]|nr:efflux RND transporter periplasmic adaptor subunit [bacterium]
MRLSKLFFIIIASALMFISIQCSRDTAGEEVTSEEVVPVELIPVRTQTMYNSINLVGDINADQEVRIFSKIADRIIRFDVDMGDRVQKGSLIAIVENSSIRSQVNQAESNLEQARSQLENLKSEFNRMQQLLREDAVSQQQYDATKTQLEATQAQVKALQEGLNQAQTRLEDSYIRSPLNGLIGEKFLEEGDMVSPQTPVVTVVKMDSVRAIVNVIERYVPEIRTGVPADIRVNSLPDTTFRGAVSKVSPVIDPVSRMVRTEIRIPNPDLLLRPGMFAEVELLLETRNDALVIPKYAILQKTELQRNQLGQQEIVRENHVYVVKNNLAHYRTVETGFELEGLVEIRAGLSPGDSVVLLGQNNLQDSTRVNVVQKEDRI